MSKLTVVISLLLASACASFIDKENEVDPTNNFALTRNKTLIIAKEDETY